MDIWFILLIADLAVIFCWFCYECHRYNKEMKQRKQSFDDYCRCWAARDRRDVRRILLEQERERERLREQLSSTDE